VLQTEAFLYDCKTFIVQAAGLFALTLIQRTTEFVERLTLSVRDRQKYAALGIIWNSIKIFSFPRSIAPFLKLPI